MDRIVRPLGADENAAVYEAADATGRRFVYTVGNRTAGDPDAYRAWSAALTAAASAHHALADVTAGGIGADGRPYLVTATGSRTLAEALVHTAPDAADVAAALAAVAAGLAALHAHGVHHGAVCPATILYEPDGGVRLAGYDTRAPEMAMPATPNAFTAPEGPTGPAADVYALAATAYTALGGELPYAHDPGEPLLRRIRIADLDGVPPAVTAALRAALHPAAESRPGAEALCAALTEVPVEPHTLTPLTGAAVAAWARAVNDTVVSVNAAVTGAAAAGIATTAGMIAGKALPGVLGAAAQAGSGTAGSAAASASASSATAGLATGWKIAIGVAVVAVGAGAVVGGIAATGENGLPGTGDAIIAEPALREDVKNVDFTGITFTEPFERGDEITLDDGTYTYDDGDDFSAYSWTLSQGPVYADVNGDAQLDAAVIVDLSGYEYGSPYLIAWTWTDGALRQLPNSWTGVCAANGLAAGADGTSFTVTVRGVNDGRGCYGTFDDELTEDALVLGVHEGHLARLEPVLGAPVPCRFEAYRTDGVEVPGTVPVYLAANTGAPRIDVGDAAVVYIAADLTYSNGWVVAQLTHADGSVSCGWIRPG